MFNATKMPYNLEQHAFIYELGQHYTMPLRENALRKWLETIFASPYKLQALAGDASFRRYFRVTTSEKSWIVMDAPPEKETGLQTFIDVSQLLETHHIPIPKIYHQHPSLGFLILDDLGDQLFAEAQHRYPHERLYEQAIDLLQRMQQCPCQTLPHFDKPHMMQEMKLAETWFLGSHLNIALTTQETANLHALFEHLADRITQQPQSFIHRDYHARNLMCQRNPTTQRIALTVIDYQDAMKGPWTYDLISLLKDCYVFLSPEERHTYLYRAYHQHPDASVFSWDTFNAHCRDVGLQRHLKILGIFSRLHLRDHKSQYLPYLPQALQYIQDACLEDHTYRWLYTFIHDRILPVFNEQQPA